MAAMVREEVDSLTRQLDATAERLKFLLLPRDPLDDRNIMLEIRAGTGGEEAALWAADLVRMCAPVHPHAGQRRAARDPTSYRCKALQSAHPAGSRGLKALLADSMCTSLGFRQQNVLRVCNFMAAISTTVAGLSELHGASNASLNKPRPHRDALQIEAC